MTIEIGTSTNPVSIPVTVGKTGTGSATKTIKLKTAGTFVDQDINVNATVSASLASNAKGSLTNDAISGQSYTEQSIGLTSGGSLYINQGFYDNTRIPLSSLIPDDANYSNAGASHIRKDFEAFSVDGTKLVGTMPNVTPAFTGGGVTINNITNKTSPTATMSSTGTLKTATIYGVSTTKPSGTDGTDYFTIGGDLSVTNGSFTMNASRSKVTYNQAYAGYLNVASGATALAATTSDVTKNATLAVSTTDNFDPLYIRKAAIGIPVITIDLFNMDTPSINYNEVLYTGTIPDSERGNYVAIETTSTTPMGPGLIASQTVDGGDYAVLPLSSNNNKTITLTKSGTGNASGTVTITGSVTATTGVNTSGVLSAAPSSGKYLTLNGSYTKTDGSVKATASYTVPKGLVTADTNISGSNTFACGVSVTNNAPKYIKVYDGSYEIV